MARGSEMKPAKLGSVASGRRMRRLGRTAVSTGGIGEAVSILGVTGVTVVGMLFEASKGDGAGRICQIARPASTVRQAAIPTRNQARRRCFLWNPARTSRSTRALACRGKQSASAFNSLFSSFISRTFRGVLIWPRGYSGLGTIVIEWFQSRSPAIGLQSDSPALPIRKEQ